MERCLGDHVLPTGRVPTGTKENVMSKRGRKRKARKNGSANHGKRPNA
ncbi:hypothetical protein CZ771_05340 [Actinomycetales bacterium JB111]|nr:hypothetical protein CZ771_05340 [Actinomycetales bacterium JB111]